MVLVATHVAATAAVVVGVVCLLFRWSLAIVIDVFGDDTVAISGVDFVSGGSSGGDGSGGVASTYWLVFGRLLLLLIALLCVVMDVDKSKNNVSSFGLSLSCLHFTSSIFIFRYPFPTSQTLTHTHRHQKYPTENMLDNYNDERACGGVRNGDKRLFIPEYTSSALLSRTI